MPDVIIINMHGGFPSSMIARSLASLAGFSKLEAMGEVHERVYPTNACAGPAMHDTLMDAPLGSMTDSVWHSWAITKTASRTLFHVFQQNGFKTRLFGAFGLDARLDPHSHMHVQPESLQSALQLYGIDVCDYQDAAFTCQLGLAHDAETIKRVISHLDSHRSGFEAIMINLLGCQDAHKCAFHDVDPAKASIPIMRVTPIETERDYDERLFSENVIMDDPRDVKSGSYRNEALKRSAQLKDWIRGEAGVYSRQDIVRTVTGLQEFCWKCVRQIDTCILAILNALERTERLQETIIYFYSDHPIGLYEHGELCEAPWEACLRSFMIRVAPSAVKGGRFATPLSLGNLPTMIMNDAGCRADSWHVRPFDGGSITLGLAMSWLARASMTPPINVFRFRTFFVRAMIVHNSRPYNVVVWFSLTDLAKVSNIEIDESDVGFSKRLEIHKKFANPILHRSFASIHAENLGLVQVFEHSTDPSEIDDLMRHRDWPGSRAAVIIKEKLDAALNHYNLDTIYLNIPSSVHAITPDRVTFCSVQLHHRVRERLHPLSVDDAPILKSTRDASTQTEVQTLERALSRAYGAEVASLITTQLRMPTDGHQNLTILAPEEVVGTKTWPTWAPLPLNGSVTPEAFRHAARDRRFFTDVVHGHSHQIVDSDDDSVFFAHCRVTLKSMSTLNFANGNAVVYKAYRYHPRPAPFEAPKRAVDVDSHVGADPPVQQHQKLMVRKPEDDDALSVVSSTVTQQSFATSEEGRSKRNSKSRNSMTQSGHSRSRTVPKSDIISSSVPQKGQVKAKEKTMLTQKR